MTGRPLAAESSNIPLLVDPRRELIDERAADVLSAYLRENRDPEPKRKRELPAPGDAFAGVAVSALLLIFFFITGPRNSAVIWFERGSADAERILLGELWRTVTALTLHADIAHAFANALVGALFIGAVCSVLGAGVGCAFVLLSGAAGNLANALFHSSHHISVGASTAVFGAVGLLSGLAVARRRGRSFEWAGRRAAPTARTPAPATLGAHRRRPRNPRHARHRGRARRSLGSSVRAARGRSPRDSYRLCAAAPTGTPSSVACRRHRAHCNSLLLGARAGLTYWVLERN